MNPSQTNPANPNDEKGVSAELDSEVGAAQKTNIKTTIEVMTKIVELLEPLSDIERRKCIRVVATILEF